jgi:hypothetical protein
MRSLTLLFMVLFSSTAQAETYRCSLPRLVVVEDHGTAKEQPTAGSNVAEIYLAIQRAVGTGRVSAITARETGSSSTCSDVCKKWLDIAVIYRSPDLRSLKLLLGDAEQIWALESSDANQQDYQTLAVSLKSDRSGPGQTAVSTSSEVRFGSCRRVMD